jgi:nucleoside 2-deoxyribosyltransferase
MITVYLAGPITGCTKGEANDWRAYVSRALAERDIRGISPLRCEPIIGERYSPDYADPKFGTARAIASKNFYDVSACDMMLAYMPKEAPAVSSGTLIEIGAAKIIQKPIVLVSDDPRVVGHPVVNAAASWVLDTLDEGIEVVLGVLGDYASWDRNVSWRAQ